MNVKHKIKRFFQRVSINSRRKMDKQQSILKSEYEKEAISICRNIILNKDTDLLISPISGKRYANNETFKIYIFIKEDAVDIINHTYQYNIPICYKSYQTILNMFDGHVEIKRKKMEEEIRSNVKHSLENILNIVKI